MGTLRTYLELNDRNFSSTVRNACGQARAQFGQLNNVFRGLNGVVGALPPQLQGAASSLSGLASAASSLINPYTAAAAAVTGLGTAFVLYNKNLQEQMDKTRKFLDIDNANDLAVVRDRIKAIATTFEGDYNTVLAEADTLMKRFGINGKEACDLIATGMAAGANEAGNMSGMITKFSGAFADAKITASEFIALLTNTQSGLVDEDTLNTLVIGLRNIREMSSKTAKALEAIGINTQKMTRDLSTGTINSLEALRQVSSKLSTMNAESQEYATAIKNLFGKNAVAQGSEVLNHLDKIVLSLDAVKANMTDVEKARNDLYESYAGLEDALQSLFGVSEVGWSTMAINIKKGCIDMCTAAINKFIDLYNSSAAFRGVLATVPALCKMIYYAVMAIMDELYAGLAGAGQLLQDIFTLEFKRIKGDAKAIANEMKRVWDKNNTGFNNSIDKFIDTINNGNIKKLDINLETTKAEQELEKYVKDLEDSISKGVSNGMSKGLTDAQQQMKSLSEGKQKYNTAIEAIDARRSNNGYADDREYYTALRNAAESYIRIIAGNYNIAKTMDEYTDDYKKMSNSIINYNNKINALNDEINTYKTKIANASKLISTYNTNNNERDIKTTTNIEAKPLAEMIRGDHYVTVIPKLDDKSIDAQIRDLESKIQKNDVAINANLELKFNIKGEMTEIQNTMNSMVAFLGSDLTNWTDDQIAQYDSLGEALNGYIEQLAKISDANDSLVASNTTASQSLEQLLEQQQKMVEQTKMLGDLSSGIGSLGDAFSSLGTAFDDKALNIAGIIAKAIAQLIQGFAAASAQAASLSPFGWMAFTMSGLAQISSVIAQIHSLSGYANGGIIGGGHRVGDKNVVRVNSGEMILNQPQQAKLWRLINGSGNSTIGAGGELFANVTIKGPDLQLALSNLNKKRNKIL